MTSRVQILKMASLIAIGGNTILAIAKLGIGYYAGSLAVIGDGIDTSTDIVISIITYIIATVIERPSDDEHPYGHGRAEAIATTALAFIVFYAGAQLLWYALHGLLTHSPTQEPSSLAVYVTIFSIIGKILLAMSQFALGKKADSDMLIANGKNMAGDILTSCAVLVGLGAVYFFGLPIIDRIVALAVSLWIIKNAVMIFINSNTELMDGSKDPELYKKIFCAVAKIDGAGNPHRTRLRKLGATLVVDLDIEVDPTMSVLDAHNIANAVEASIKTDLPEVYDVIIHIEPIGHDSSTEKFGLRPSTTNSCPDTE